MAKRGRKPLDRVTGFVTRCLGPGKAEHTFLSADPSRERVCPACRRKQKESRHSPMCEEPLRVTEGPE